MSRLFFQNRSLLPLFVFSVLLGCTEETVTSGGICGDTICAMNESPESCAHDCTYLCIPETSRCVGNSWVTCSEDGLHEESQSCEQGEICIENEGCQFSGISVDAGNEDEDMSFSEDPQPLEDLTADLMQQQDTLALDTVPGADTALHDAPDSDADSLSFDLQGDPLPEDLPADTSDTDPDDLHPEITGAETAD